MSMNYCIYCMEQLGPNGGTCANCGRQQDYSAPAHHMRPGSRLQNRYLVGRALGEGGFGITYIGRDTMLDMRVAIKEFYPSGYSYRMNSVSNRVSLTNGSSGADHEKDMQRFLSEARILAKFSDEPGIVGVRDFFQENGTAYIVMEYLDGITLKEYLVRSGTIPARQLFGMLDPVMVSLDRIHGQNLVHRDISPDNIMVLRNGKLKLLDFGAARDTSGGNSLSVVLKHGYAPVEQYQTRGNQGPWTDVYALCATMYKCLTGITPLESLERIYQDDLKRPSALGVEIEPAQESALMEGLQVRAQNRFQSIDALRRALKATGSFHNASVHTPGGAGAAVEDADDRTILESAYRYNGGAIRPDKIGGEKKKETPGNGAYRQSGSQIPKDSAQNQGKYEKKQPQPEPQPRPQPKPTPEPAPNPGPKPKSGMNPILLIAAIVAVIAVVIVFSGRDSGASSAPASSGVDTVVSSQVDVLDGDYVLELEGTISDPNRELSVMDGLVQSVDGGIHLLTYLGENKNQVLLADEYSSVDYLGQGLYTIQKLNGGDNCMGLVDENGQTLIPCEAALIDWPTMTLYDEHPPRYLLVAYSEGAVSNKDDAIMTKFNWGFSFGKPYSDDAVGYKGYARIYDVQAKAFVGDIRVTEDLYNTVKICRDNFIVRSSEGSQVYNPKGEKVMLLSEYVDMGPGIFVEYRNNVYQVMDENGNELFTSTDYVYAIYGSNGYLARNNEDGCTVLDTYGNEILTVTGKQIHFEYNNVFEYATDDTYEYGLIRKDGTEILEAKDTDWVSYLGNGLFYTSNKDDDRENKYTLIGMDGIIATDLPYPGNLAMEENDKLFVVADGDFTLDIGERYPNFLDTALVRVADAESNLYGVYELYTGKQLLPYEYNTVATAGGYLYAYKDGVWEVYSYPEIKGQI